MGLYIGLHHKYGIIIGSERIFTMEWRRVTRVTRISWLRASTGRGGSGGMAVSSLRIPSPGCDPLQSSSRRGGGGRNIWRVCSSSQFR